MWRTGAGARSAAVTIALVAMLGLAGCTSDEPDQASTPDVSSTIQKIMDEPRFKGATWGIYAVNLDTGKPVIEVNPDTLMMMGSNAKIFSVGSALAAFGADHTFDTPVYAVGKRSGSTLDGDLVLVASGDLVMGGRGVLDGELQISGGDHNDANALPFGSLTEGDPLAGLADLAKQVAASGITTVDGNVLIDDRLFETNDAFFHGIVSPIVVNDNVVDVTVTPGKQGEAASVEWRPHSPAYTVTSEVTTAAPGEANAISISANADESVLTVSGQVAADADPQLRVYEVESPADFARTLFIEELKKAGVTVKAKAVGANPEGDLPEASGYTDEVAKLVSPPLSDIVHLVLQVSYNRGADLLTCMLATTAGSTTCDDGLVVEGKYAQEAKVPDFSVLLEDGSGGDERSRLSPRATVTFLDYLSKQSYGEAFKSGLPVLGKTGSLAITTVDGPAVGHVFAKTGTAAWGFPDGQDGVFVGSKAIGGYIDAASGAHLAFAVYVNGAVASDIEQMLNIGVDDVAAALYEEN